MCSKAGFFVLLLENLDMRFCACLMFFIVVSCSSSSSTAIVTETEEINLSTIKETLSYMASDELKGRKAGEEGNRLAAEYLIEKLESYGVKPFFSGYRDTLSDFQTTWNIVGVLKGTDSKLKEEYIVLGAHYDHIGIRSSIGVERDSIANGANDNASGVAILTEVARQMSRQNLKRSVIIAYFTAEEDGLLGSKHLAEKLKREGINVAMMLNFEMLGVPMNREYRSYLTGYNKSNIAEVFQMKKPNLIGEFEGEAERFLFQRSDNYPFYLAFGVPSHTFSSFDFDNYDYYHHVKDEYKEMDLEHIKEFTKDIIPLVGELINAPLGLIKNKK